jgi:hypothetical protein
MISNCIKGRPLQSRSLQPRVSSWQAGLPSHHRLNFRVAHHKFRSSKTLGEQSGSTQDHLP